MRHIRDLVAISVLGICALSATLRHFWDNRGVSAFHEIALRITDIGKAAGALRRLGVGGDDVGFINDGDPSDETEITYELQYQLAPTILVQSFAPRLVIFHSWMPQHVPRILEQNHLVLIANVGHGFYLMKHEKP